MMLFRKSVFLFFYVGGVRPRKALNTIETTNKTRKTINRILAIPTDAPAIPEKPSTPAISAIIKNVRAQPNMGYPFVVCI